MPGDFSCALLSHDHKHPFLASFSQRHHANVAGMCAPPLSMCPSSNHHTSARVPILSSPSSGRRVQPSSQPPNVVCIEMPWPSFLCVFLDRPGQVFKLSRGGLARHNFPYADLPAFIDPIETNKCVSLPPVISLARGWPFGVCVARGGACPTSFPLCIFTCLYSN